MIVKFGVPLTYTEKKEKEKEYIENIYDIGENNGFCETSKRNDKRGCVKKQ